MHWPGTPPKQAMTPLPPDVSNKTNTLACTAAAMTSPTAGAITIIQLHGQVSEVLARLTGRDDWTPGPLRLCSFADIDHGLAVMLGPDSAQLMPHGGVRIRQRLLEELASHGVTLLDQLEPVAAYPEATDEIEAAALATIPRATSPLAIELLLHQSRRWQECDDWNEADELRSQRLNRLLSPPQVVIAGPPNIGKSTLMNALVGREVAISIDAPGTTRDFVAWPVELGGLVVTWHDTPGRHQSEDQLEQEAITRSTTLIEQADMLISATDLGTPWLDLPRDPELRMGLKSDLGLRRDADLCVSAHTGEGIIELVEWVREHLVPAVDLGSTRPWRFTESPIFNT